MLELILLDGSGRRVALPEGVELTVGTAAGCSVVLTAPDVSRRHALLSCRRDRAIVLDLGSRNGTFLNGQRVEEAELGAGDVLRFSSVMAQLVPAGSDSGESAAPSPAEDGGDGGPAGESGALTSERLPALFDDSYAELFARWGTGGEPAQAALVAWLVSARRIRGAAVVETTGGEVVVVAAHGDVRRVLEDPKCAEVLGQQHGDGSPEGVSLTLAGERVLAVAANGPWWLVLVPGAANPDAAELSALTRLLAVARRLDGGTAGGGR